MVIKMSELYHYGVIGQKWGVRNYQNPDGSLTAAGRKRYSTGDKKVELSRDKYLRSVGNYDRAVSEAKKRGLYKEYKNNTTGNKVVINNSLVVRRAQNKAVKAFNIYRDAAEKQITGVHKQYKRGKVTLDEAKNIIEEYSNIHFEVAQRMYGLEEKPEINSDNVVYQLMKEKK